MANGNALARRSRVGNARLQCWQIALAFAYVKLGGGLTIGIEGNALLPYVKRFWAKTGIFLNVQRGQIL